MNKCSKCKNESNVLMKKGNKLICKECLKPKCNSCDSKRLISISGKTSDCFDAKYGNKDYDGYVLTDIGIGDDSDYIQLTYCLNCGKIQGKFPIDEQIVINQIEGRASDEDEESEDRAD